MEKTLAIGIDLGGDTAKIAYAIDCDGSTVYGKFANGNPLIQIAIPAVACYDEENGRWLFGREVEKCASRNFMTVVKIKNLLSLLSHNKNQEIENRNKEYYCNKFDFPKFYFPVRKKMLDDFGLMKESGMTFVSPYQTPRSVCEQFFYYLHAVAKEKTIKLENTLGVKFDQLKIALVYPSHVGDEYVNELIRITQTAFGCDVYKTLSSTKALTMYADYSGALGERENILVFDMGEEFLTVAKACYSNGSLVVEGVEGHNEPLSVGGINVDEAINDFLEYGIGKRETMGAPSFGGDGRINEHGVYGKQYLLMKDIKKAKVILSRPIDEDSAFYNGVPINISRDLLLQRKLTKENLLDCVGITNDSGVAKQILDYIVKELTRPTNKNVNKIILSGGLSETLGLVDFIKQALGENPDLPKVEVYDFEDQGFDGDEFTILSNEANIYAQAVGGAIVALKDIEVKTVISLSYATWSYRGEQEKCLEIFVNRGQPIDGDMEFSTQLSLGGEGIGGEEMFSTIITEYEIKGRKYAGNIAYSTSGKLMIGEDNSAYRRAAIQNVDLKMVAGGSNSRIYFKYDGEVIKILGTDVVQFEEGIKVDKNGRATPFIRNCSPTRRIEILWRGSKIYANAKDIEIVFDSVSSFSVIKD